MKREIDKGCGTFYPSLAELVSDPLIGLMMKSDGVDRRTIELLFERLAGERDRAPSPDRSLRSRCGHRSD